MIQAKEVDSGDKKQRSTGQTPAPITACGWTNRNRFHFNATILGVPQPKTFCVDVGSTNQIGHFHIATYPVVVKTALQLTNKNTVCYNQAQLEEEVSKLSSRQDYQVQEWLDNFEFFHLEYRHGKVVIRKKDSQEILAVTHPSYQKIRGVSKRLISLLVSGGHKKFELQVACGEHATYPLECRL